MTAEEFADPRSKMLVHAARRMEMVSPHRPVPFTYVPFFETVLGWRFEDELEKIPRGQDHRRNILVF